MKLSVIRLLFLSLRSRIHRRLTTSDEVYQILLDFWLFVVIVSYYDMITQSIITSVFYNIPKPVLLAIVTGCLCWSVICFMAKERKYKLSAIVTNIGLYLWVATTALSTNPISVVSGTYLILAFRYIVLYFTLKAQEGGDVGVS